MIEKWVIVITIDIHFPCERELGFIRIPLLQTRSHIFHAIENLGGVGPRLLLPKLVAWERQDPEIRALTILIN